MQSIQTKWDEIYRQRDNYPTAALVLEQNRHLLPESGVALDLACGQGGNALMLADSGFEVHAWDASGIAIEQLHNSAKGKGLIVNGLVRDVVNNPPYPNSVDILIVSFFLERKLCPSIFTAIRPGGILFYQTYCRQKVNQQGPSNPDYLLEDNELLQLFSPMKVRVYREEAMLGDRDNGVRNMAMLVAEKPVS